MKFENTNKITYNIHGGDKVAKSKKEPTFTFVGKPDAKKAIRLLIELYCEQEGYEITELVFASDKKQEGNDDKTA